ncbi:hypothetical protein V6N13_065181 [Hibiscus sabdariffa]
MLREKAAWWKPRIKKGREVCRIGLYALWTVEIVEYFGNIRLRFYYGTAKRVLPGDSDSKIVSHGSLDSSVSQECPIPSNSQLSSVTGLNLPCRPFYSKNNVTCTPDSFAGCSEKLEESSSIKPRKKVRFNMNVQMYDPAPEKTPAYRFLHREEREIYYRYIISRRKIR